MIADADDGPVLRVRGKGRAQRTIPLSPEVLDAIDTYLQDRAPGLGPRAHVPVKGFIGLSLALARCTAATLRVCARAGAIYVEILVTVGS